MAKQDLSLKLAGHWTLHLMHPMKFAGMSKVIFTLLKEILTAYVV